MKKISKKLFKRYINYLVNRSMRQHGRNFDHLDDDDIREMIDDVIGDFDFSYILRDAIDEHDFSDVISNAVDDHDFSDDVADAVENYDFSSVIHDVLNEFDFHDVLVHYMENECNQDLRQVTENLIKEKFADGIPMDLLGEIVSNKLKKFKFNVTISLE